MSDRVYSNGISINNNDIGKMLLDIDRKLNSISTIEELQQVRIEVVRLRDDFKALDNKITKIFNLTDSHKDMLSELSNELGTKPSIKYLDELITNLKNRVDRLDNQHIQEEGVKKGMTLMHKLYAAIIFGAIIIISFFNDILSSIIGFFAK